MASMKRDGAQQRDLNTDPYRWARRRPGRESRSLTRVSRRVGLHEAGRVGESEHIGLVWGQAEKRHSPKILRPRIYTLMNQRVGRNLKLVSWLGMPTKWGG